MRVQVGGKFYDVGGLSQGEKQVILDEANQYANELNSNMQEEIDAINTVLDNLDEVIDDAFKDGIISEAEAKIIQSQLRLLASKKTELDREYSDIFGNVHISPESQASLTSAKEFYDTKYTDLVNEINNTIADGKADAGEIALVDQAFLDYDASISLLVSALTGATQQIGQAKSDKAYEDSVGYTDGKIAPIETRLLSAESELTQTAEEILLRVTKTEMETTMGVVKQEAIDEAKEYADQLVMDSNPVIGNLQDQINETNTYIDNAFKDGLVSSLEASGISNYLNTLIGNKNSFDASYNELYANAYLKGAFKTNLANAKTNLNLAHDNLISAINTAIADSNATPEEQTDVDAKFQLYNDCITIYRLRLEQGADSIGKEKALEAQNNAEDYTDGVLVPITERLVTAESTITQHADEIALRVTEEVLNAGLGSTLNSSKAYADGLKVIVDGDIGALQGQVNDTLAYIDDAFRDGIIYEAEYKKIQAYLNTLSGAKIQLDNRYNEIYNNAQLVGTVKTDLATSKTSYNTRYTALVDTINTVIADQLADATETQAVNTAFVSYNNSIALLSVSLEKAIDAIAKSKSDKALADAKVYTDGIKEELDAIVADLDADMKATDGYINTAFKDGVVSAEEAKRITGYLNIINTSNGSFEQKFLEIYNNESLGATYKSELQIYKSQYDTKYQALLASITSAIADGLSTPAEASDVDIKFKQYNSASDNLTYALERSINNITKNKADKALSDAQDLIEPIDERLSTAESTIIQHSDEIALRVTETVFTKAIEDVKKEVSYKLEIFSTNGLFFKNGQIDTALQCYVYKGMTNVTDTIDASRFIWKRISADPTGDIAWNNEHSGVKAVLIDSADVFRRATFSCEILDIVN